ncbi:MAG: glycosyltransferase family 9 protein [Elusimicrobiota bacterium]
MGCKNFAALGKKILDKENLKILISCGPGESAIMEECKNLAKDRFMYLPQFGLRHLASFLKKADLCISNDTGILHIAAAVRSSTIGLFGPTFAARWNPIGRNNLYIQSATDNINDISVDAVMDKVDEIMQLG